MSVYIIKRFLIVNLQRSFLVANLCFFFKKKNILNVYFTKI